MELSGPSILPPAKEITRTEFITSCETTQKKNKKRKSSIERTGKCSLVDQEGYISNILTNRSTSKYCKTYKKKKERENLPSVSVIFSNQKKNYILLAENDRLERRVRGVVIGSYLHGCSGRSPMNRQREHQRRKTTDRPLLAVARTTDQYRTYFII